MATALDTKLVAAVLSLIDTFGTNMDFEIPASQHYILEEQRNVKKTPSTVTRKASPPLQYESKYITQGVVRQDDTQIFIAASGLTFTPAEGLKVTHASIVWNMVAANPLYSGDDIAAWHCQLRR